MPLEGGAIYGGQLLMQVLSVAADTLPGPMHAHYLQATFVAAGDATRPLEIAVNRVRDGKNTCQRHVEISQAGRTLLLASLSFQNEADGFEQQQQARYDDHTAADAEHAAEQAFFGPPSKQDRQRHACPARTHQLVAAAQPTAVRTSTAAVRDIIHDAVVTRQRR